MVVTPGFDDVIIPDEIVTPSIVPIPLILICGA
jgi:hypothetical protein